jgi:hypothetical protein
LQKKGLEAQLSQQLALLNDQLDLLKQQTVRVEDLDTLLRNQVNQLSEGSMVSREERAGAANAVTDPANSLPTTRGNDDRGEAKLRHAAKPVVARPRLRNLVDWLRAHRYRVVGRVEQHRQLREQTSAILGTF